jgi:hypothetical protein
VGTPHEVKMKNTDFKWTKTHTINLCINLSALILSIQVGMGVAFHVEEISTSLYYPAAIVSSFAFYSLLSSALRAGEKINE